MTEDHPEIVRKDAMPVDGALQQETKAWLLTLPPSLLPKALAKHFPRIANRVARLWAEPVQCERYLDELLFNDRAGNRQGFPPKACMEIMRLKGYILDFLEERRAVNNPPSRDVWEIVDPRLLSDD